MKRGESSSLIDHLVEHDSPSLLLVPGPEPDPPDLTRSQCLGHPFMVEPALAVNGFLGDRSVSVDNCSYARHRHEWIGIVEGIVNWAGSGKELFVRCMPDRGREGG